MRRVALVFLLVLLPASTLLAQDYEVVRSTGDHGFMFAFRQSAGLAFAPPKDNELSTWQALPFPWKFFGQDVKGYFISDNGYITFDAQAKWSVATNTALPHASAPRNSIFAFWTDMRLEAGHGQWAGSVYAATLGEAPNRTHVIYWMSPVPAGESFDRAGFNFALALHENGDAEVIYTSGRKASPVKATVGIVSADGTAVLAAGPDFDFPNVGYGGEDDVSIRFKKK